MAEYKDKSKLSSILELQDFLKDELAGSSNESLISRAFTPITDGLGLESPKKPEYHIPEKAFKTEIIETSPPTMVEKQIKNFLDSESIEAKPEKKFPEKPAFIPEEKPAETLSDIMRVKSASKDMPKRQARRVESDFPSTPPPLPNTQPVPLFKRAAAIVIDQVLVATLFCIALVFTSNVMTDFSTGFSSRLLKDFSNPVFVRFAIIEFSVIWLAYLTICLFLLNTTFGMWVWGLKVSFGDRSSDKYSMRKLMRVIWSFIFCAPIVTMALLFIRKQGKNVIDILSGSQVCGSES